MQNNPDNRRKTDNNPITKMNYMDENYDIEPFDNDPNSLIKRNSDNCFINQNTMLNISSSNPQGIDFNKFLSNVNSLDETVHAISQTNDLPIIAEISEQHQSFKGIMHRRLQCLKMISNWWINHDINSALRALESMKDSALANDVFYHAIIKSDLEKTPITLDNVITLLPMVLNLINSKYDVHWINGIRTAHKLLQCIHDRVTSTKNANFASGVDLAREERLRKCDIIIEYFEKILSAGNVEKIMNRKKEDDLYKYTSQFVDQLQFFLKTCKKNN